MESIKQIYERFPNVKKKVLKPNDPSLSLTNQEAVFYQLAQFFTDPDRYSFSINAVYTHLKDEDLIFALEILIVYFQKDTKLVQNVSQSFYNSSLLNEQIMGQKRFAQKVEESIQGISFKPSQVHLYWKRQSDRIPRPDLIIDGTPYWTEGSVDLFISQEKKIRKKKNKR